MYINPAAEIIKNKGATFYAVTVSVCRLCSMLLSAYNSIVTVSTMMHGEYGLEDVCISTLAIVGPNGVQGKLPVRLTEDENAKAPRFRRQAERNHRSNLF